MSSTSLPTNAVRRSTRAQPKRSATATPVERTTGTDITTQTHREGRRLLLGKTEGCLTVVLGDTPLRHNPFLPLTPQHLRGSAQWGRWGHKGRGGTPCTPTVGSPPVGVWAVSPAHQLTVSTNAQDAQHWCSVVAGLRPSTSSAALWVMCRFARPGTPSRCARLVLWLCRCRLEGIMVRLRLPCVVGAVGAGGVAAGRITLRVMSVRAVLATLLRRGAPGCKTPGTSCWSGPVRLPPSSALFTFTAGPSGSTRSRRSADRLFSVRASSPLEGRPIPFGPERISPNGFWAAAVSRRVIDHLFCQPR